MLAAMMMVRPMTDASDWRLDLARQIAPIYAADPRVEAIAAAGSVGRGCADRWSDVEIGIYWSDEPSARPPGSSKPRTKSCTANLCIRVSEDDPRSVSESFKMEN